MIDTPEVSAVFRTEWPRLVATLLRDVGDLGVAEDAAQDAFVEAAARWSTDGTPARPGAWLLTTARRKVIDRIRREARFADRMPLLIERDGEEHGGHEPSTALDDQLALLLGCCHPALAPDAQVALTLRAVAGLSTAQIARAFLVSESTMTRRLTRSKVKIRDAVIPFEPPDLATLNARLPSVCSVIYSIFTEGHASATDAVLVRGDLCDEAIWLAELLATLVPDDPEVAGLHALVLLIDARRATRIHDGVPVLLADQDRSRWNRATIGRGLAELARAHAAHSAGMFQFQAAVAALHATAPSFDQTDWAGVVRLYDVMLRREPSALVALNRAIAIGQLEGPAVALRALDAIPLADDLAGDLDDYVYFHSARAEVLADLGRHAESRDSYRRAIALSANASERRQLERRADLLR
jgi:RNA polymerase sigma-70 factor (ECF subfamily)